MSKVIEKFKLPNLICSEMLPNNILRWSGFECVGLVEGRGVLQDLLCLLPPVADIVALSKSKVNIHQDEIVGRRV